MTRSAGNADVVELPSSEAFAATLERLVTTIEAAGLRIFARIDHEGRTLVSFHPVVPMLTKAGVDEALARRLEPAQQLLVNAILP
jgi:hypothetical protein